MSEKESERERIFKTEFINRKTDQSVQIMFADRPSGLFVPPNASFIMENDDPLELYSRYEKVQYLRNNDVKLTLRKNWAEIEKTLDYGELYMCEFWNRDGSTWVSVYLGGERNRPTLIPKSIPRFLGVPLDSMYVKFTKYIWQFEIRKTKIEGSNYFTEEWGLQQYGIERPKEELKKIGELIKERDLKIAKENTERNVDIFVKQRGLV